MAVPSPPSGLSPHPQAYAYSNSHSNRKSTDSSRSSQSNLTSTSPCEPAQPSFSRSTDSYGSNEPSPCPETEPENQRSSEDMERRRSLEIETSLRKRDYAVRVSRLMGDQLVKGLNRGWRAEKREEERREADRSRHKKL